MANELFEVTEVTAPEEEPLEPADVKTHCVIDDDADDELLRTYIAAARATVENDTGRQLMPATKEMVLDGFPACGEIRIPYPPLIEVLSVTYLDPAGDEQTMDEADYVVDRLQGEACQRSFLRLAYGAVWPFAQSVRRSVRIRFRCGYVVGEDAEEEPAIPVPIKYAMMVAVAESYRNRQETIQGTISTEAANTMVRMLNRFVLR